VNFFLLSMKSFQANQFQLLFHPRRCQANKFPDEERSADLACVYIQADCKAARSDIARDMMS
jgi:hypothetical protein